MIGPATYGLIGLIIAGIVHISAILAMPLLAPRDGFVRLNTLVSDNHMSLLDARQLRETVPFSDPALAAAACRYVLDRGPVRIRVAVGRAPLSITLLRKGGGIFHSVNDKAATQGVLEVVIATREQMDHIIELDTDDEPVQEIRVISADEVGLALVRALVPTPSQRADTEALIGGATCEPEVLDGQG